MKKHGTVENHIADYREWFFEPGIARHNTFNTENFPSTISISISLLPFSIFLSILLQLFLPSPDRYDAAKRVLLNRAFLISLHSSPSRILHSSSNLLSSAAPSPCDLTVRSAFVSSTLYTSGFWKILRWLSCLEETWDAVGGTF